MYRSKNGKIRWGWLVVILVVFLIASAALGYFFQKFLGHYQIPQSFSVWLVMLIILGILIVVNLSVLPIPFGISILIAAAGMWNPVLVAFVGSLGSCIGESSSYYIGRIGKKIAIGDDVVGYKMVKRWVDKYGMWAIAFLSFQPIIPFELGGLVAGAMKMPFKKFFPALCIGKFPKYLILIFLGQAILHIVPSNIFH